MRADVDTPKAAGIIALSAIAVLVLLRRGFGGVALRVGD